MNIETQRIVSLFLTFSSSSDKRVYALFCEPLLHRSAYSIQAACPALAICLPRKEEDH
jgi:hypothetical protein